MEQCECGHERSRHDWPLYGQACWECGSAREARGPIRMVLPNQPYRTWNKS